MWSFAQVGYQSLSTTLRSALGSCLAPPRSTGQWRVLSMPWAPRTILLHSQRYGIG